MEHGAYYRAARFQGEEVSGEAYFRAQDAIFHAPKCDLSTYRIRLDNVWHVLVMGQQPVDELDATLRSILSAGEVVAFSDDLLKHFWKRRIEATRIAPWVERHSRDF